MLLVIKFTSDANANEDKEKSAPHGFCKPWKKAVNRDLVAINYLR